MSIAGISSNFTPVSTTAVQAAANEYAEDEQVLTQTLDTTTLANQTSLLTGPPATELAAGAGALNALPNSTINPGTSVAGLNAPGPTGGSSGFGIEATDNNGNSQTSTQAHGPLQSLWNSTQPSAQQAYASSQAGPAPVASTAFVA